MNDPKNKIAYPLSWPTGWPRTEARSRALFKAELAGALHKLRREVKMMGGKALVLSSNYTLGAETPKDPGVVCYFDWQGLPMAIPCDRWDRIADNCRAITLTIEAMRGMERWGAKHMIKAMFSGFKQLPAKSESSDWWRPLGLAMNASTAQVKEAHRLLVLKFHPDNQQTGDGERFRAVQAGYEEFQRNQKANE